MSITRSQVLGFTLLELLIVMTLIGIAALLVVPRVGGGQMVQLQAQVREAVALLNYARRSAIIDGKVQTVILLPGAAEQPVPIQNNTWTSRGATLAWSDQTTEHPKDRFEITFYPEGGSSGGELIITQEDKFKMKITVHPITGKIIADFVKS
jgi:general secretion pathway protein H